MTLKTGGVKLKPPPHEGTEILFFLKGLQSKELDRKLPTLTREGPNASCKYGDEEDVGYFIDGCFEQLCEIQEARVLQRLNQSLSVSHLGSMKMWNRHCPIWILTSRRNVNMICPLLIALPIYSVSCFLFASISRI